MNITKIQETSKKTIFLPVLLLLTSFVYAQTITFTESQNIPGTFPTAVELVDLDGDTDLDMVRTIFRASGLNDLNTNEIWLNDGTGNYSLHQEFGNSQSRDVSFGDVDGDNDIDLFIANATFFIGQSSISANKVWLNDGAANFTSNGQLLGVRQSLAVVLADLDGDNDLDAYVGNSSQADNKNTVWINDGAGQFTNSGQLLGSYRTESVAAADIDNDNDIDIITANCCTEPGGANRVWVNNGAGVFTNTQAIGQISTSEVSIADLDGDGDEDIVFSNTFEPSRTYLNNGSGNFSLNGDISDFPIIQSQKVKFSDIDDDGDNDLVLGVFSSENTSRILINDGAGNFTDDFEFMIANTTDIAIGDINNDGKKDVFLLNTNNQNSQFWLNEGTLSLDEDESSVSLKVYPNPIQNDVTVQLDKTYDTVTVTIYNVVSQKIYTQEFTTTKELYIPFQGPKGVYFMELKTDQNESKIYKLLKG